MSSKAYAMFHPYGEKTFRTNAYLQFGKSSASIGSFLMLSPESAELVKPQVLAGAVMGEIRLDRTMNQIVKIVKKHEPGPIEGRVYMYNLLPIKNTKSNEVLQEEITKEYIQFLYDSIDHFQKKNHPWVVIGWGVNQPTRFKELKEKWLDFFETNQVRTYGVRGEGPLDYYHPSPELASDQAVYLERITAQFQAAPTLKDIARQVQPQADIHQLVIDCANCSHKSILLTQEVLLSFYCPSCGGEI
ncbi:hypothetical protein ACFOU2_17500 [Bacillus songklensis]|uniref:DUF1643 domain-containing protein n=1 Tax=Bacillus songklensis TaxID=1069116 RepID=A0ABV8B711_9BACI